MGLHWIDPNNPTKVKYTGIQTYLLFVHSQRYRSNEDKRTPSITIEVHFGRKSGTGSNPIDRTKVKHCNTNVLPVCPGPTISFHRCNQGKRTPTIAIVIHFNRGEVRVRLWSHTGYLTLDPKRTTTPKSSTRKMNVQRVGNPGSSHPT